MHNWTFIEASIFYQTFVKVKGTLNLLYDLVLFKDLNFTAVVLR